MKIAWRGVAVGFLCFTLIGLIFSAQFYLYLHSFGRPVTWGQTLSWNLGSWYLWALLSPGIFRVSRRYAPTRGRWSGTLAAHLGFGLVMASVHVVAYSTWTWLVAPLDRQPSTWLQSVRSSAAMSFSWDLFCYAAIAIAFYAVDYARRFREGETRTARLEAALAQAQLEALRMQLHPHFLFNTLNTIAALIREDPGGAEDMVTKLSDLLRLALEKSDVRRIPLREELDFVRKYLDIQRVRFGERLDARLEIAAETLDAEIPTFLLQPLIENAVRHGLNVEEGKCQVRVIARITGNVLRVEVHDSGPGLSRETGRLAREGVGLSNIKARLRQEYGDRAALELGNGDAGGCVVTLELPMNSTDRADAEFER